METLLKLIYKVNRIPIKIPISFFFNGSGKTNPKIYIEEQRARKSQDNFGEEEGVGDTLLATHQEFL